MDYFSFFNHSDLRADGGSNFLVKFLKAFAAARARFRLVAVFDNDAIGALASRQAIALSLPKNFAVLRLPDIEVARDYPTVGPQGLHRMDVNGKAASIELYLGRAALSGDQGPRPVRWTGYSQEAKAYQGEVDEKARVVQAFIESLSKYNDSLTARHAHPDLVTVWRAIFAEVSDSAEDTQRNTRPSLIEW
jgi:hypothetical protein